MRKTILLALSILVTILVSSSALAQGQVSSKPVAFTRALNLSPDSFLYGLGVALDKIRLDLTFNNTARAELGLKIAEDRISEAQSMILDKKFDLAQSVLSEYNKTLGDVRSSVVGISSTNPDKELVDKIVVEKELEQHESDAENFLSEVSVKASLSGNLTQSQLSLLNSFVSFLLNSTGEVKIVVNNGIEKTKLRIEQETGKNISEVEHEVNDLENRTGLTVFMQEKAKDAISDAAGSLNDLLDKLNSTNMTGIGAAVNTLLSQSQSKLGDAKTAFNQSDFGRAFGLAKASESLSENAERILETNTENQQGENHQGGTDVEARVIGNQTEVKVEHNGFENTFFVNTTDINSAVKNVANQLGIGVNEINLKIKQSLPDIESKIQKISDEVNKKMSSIFGEGGLKGFLITRILANSSSTNVTMNER